MLQKLEEKDETAVEIKENFSSLQQEVDVKTKKLKKVKLFWSLSVYLSSLRYTLYAEHKEPNKLTNI